MEKVKCPICSAMVKSYDALFIHIMHHHQKHVITDALIKLLRRVERGERDRG